MVTVEYGAGMETFIKIRVQKGVPMPPRKPRGRNGTKEAKYPWSTMDVGDSFLFPASIGRGAHGSAINASVDGREFAVFKTDEGYRCWRIR